MHESLIDSGKKPHFIQAYNSNKFIRRPIFSVRIGIGWRAVGTKDENDMIWFWIGPHAEYDRLVSKL